MSEENKRRLLQTKAVTPEVNKSGDLFEMLADIVLNDFPEEYGYYQDQRALIDSLKIPKDERDAKLAKLDEEFNPLFCYLESKANAYWAEHPLKQQIPFGDINGGAAKFVEKLAKGGRDETDTYKLVRFLFSPVLAYYVPDVATRRQLIEVSLNTLPGLVKQPFSDRHLFADQS